MFAVFFSGLAGLRAKEIDYASSLARGLAIYKKHDFASDNSALLFEYRTFAAHDRVSYLITSAGNRITIPIRGTSLLLIPYPGKGEATPQQAIAVIELARTRYPQYQTHLAKLQVAWEKEADRPASEIQKEITTREKNKETGFAFIEWLKGLSSNLPPLKIAPSLLDGEWTGQEVKSADPEKTEGDEAETNTEPDPQDLKGNLKHIQDAYKAIDALQAEQP